MVKQCKCWNASSSVFVSLLGLLIWCMWVFNVLTIRLWTLYTRGLDVPISTEKSIL